MNKFFLVIGLLGLMLLGGCHSENESETFAYRAALHSVQSCEALTDYLLETANKQQQLYSYVDSAWLTTAVDADDVSAGAESADTDSEDTTSISAVTGTNNQVSGVDEPDIIKTDGEYTYVLSGGSLVILDTWPAATSEQLAQVELSGYPSQLLMYNDLIWVVSRIYDYAKEPDIYTIGFAARNTLTTRVSVFDVSDHAKPELVRQIDFEAGYLDARLLDGEVYMVLSSYLDLYPYVEQETLPEMTELLPTYLDVIPSQGMAAEATLISECEQIFLPETANGTGAISLVSLDLDNPESPLNTQMIISNGGEVYASTESLYLAVYEDYYWAWLPVMDGDEEQPLPGTMVHRFSLGETIAYQSSGRVDGYLLNSFSMDEYQGFFRIVTTENNWWSEEDPKNTLFVLSEQDGELVEQARLENLGKPGERVYAVRFVADKGYVVTFEQIDPLYTLDLSNPLQPLAVGELEVPGFSTYLHPIDGDLLLAVGRSVENFSVDISLFDVADFSSPQLLSKMSLGSGSYSEAEYNHKAFTWYQQENMLALPVTQWNAGVFETDALADDSDYQMFTGLRLFRVSSDEGISEVGAVDHNELYRSENAGWYYPEPVRRSFFVLDDSDESFLYSLSSRGLKVNAVADLELGIDASLATLPLPYDDYAAYY